VRTTTFVSFKHVPFFLLTSLVLTKNGIRTLVDIVIANLTWVDLLPRSCTTQGFVISNAVQANEASYRDWPLANQFLPLVMEVFGCLHKHAYVFLHNCVSAIWSLKGLESPPLFVLITFLWQKNSITLQRLQTSSILNWVVAIGLTTSQLPPL
jgi:hypothetical protein